jgi:hypothetical protein
MSDSPDALDQQLAALEAAPQLPPHEEMRQRLMADLRAAHAFCTSGAHLWR